MKRERYRKPQKYDLLDNHINGYFIFIANSRGGHNFIRKNLLSYLNDIDCETRRYINLENQTPSFYSTHYSNLNSINENSIHMLSTRCLLNWFSSITHFILKRYVIKGNEIHNNMEYYMDKPKETFENKIVMYEDEVNGNPEILSNPNVVIFRNPRETKLDIKEGKIYDIGEINKRIYSYLVSWLEIAKEFKNDTNYTPNFTKIYYDSFVEDEMYRKSICGKINGEYNEEFINVVPRNGRGSSFDKQNFDGNGSEMKVLERYKRWEINGLNDPSPFIRILKNHEAYEFYLNNFDVSQEKKDFMKDF